jgi:dipeptidyl aminopeptidase/acylaminoacyl peptidase
MQTDLGPIAEKYEHNGWPALPRPDAVSPQGWSLPLVAGLRRVHHHRLSPDGAQLAFVWETGDGLSDIFVQAVTGGWPQRLSFERRSIPYWWDVAPRFSPDGRWLAFNANRHVEVVDLQGGLPHVISDFATGAASPVWMPDSCGLILNVERGGISRLLLSDREGAWPRPFGNGAGDEGDAHPSPDGQLVAYTLRPRDDLNRCDLMLADLRDGTQCTLLALPGERHYSPRFAPDGSQIAFLSQRSGWHAIWLVNPDGSALRQLTQLSHDISDIAWSPDGRHIACGVNRDGAIDLALVDAASGEVSYLRSGKGVHTGPCWSADGSFLTVEYESPLDPPDILQIAVAGTLVRQLTHSKPPALAPLELVVPERLYYRSFDGLEIPSLLYRPPQPNGAAIVYPHGGPRDQYLYDWDVFAQYLVAKGYTFIAPDFRGSTGHGRALEYGNQHNWGVGDTQDVLAAADVLTALDGIDAQRIAIYGGSYGGYMVANCMARDPQYRFACGVYKYGDANLKSSWAQCEHGTRLYTEMQMGHPAEARAAYRAASPLFDAANIKRPMLLLHGLDDDVCPPQSSEELVAELRRHNITFEYRTYSGVAHGFIRRADVVDVYQRIERFLDWYLL